MEKAEDHKRLASPLLKSLRNMANVISMGSLEISSSTAQNVKFGSKRNVSITLIYVLNQI